jgi:hypothetical protein
MMRVTGASETPASEISLRNERYTSHESSHSRTQRLQSALFGVDQPAVTSSAAIQ